MNQRTEQRESLLDKSSAKSAEASISNSFVRFSYNAETKLWTLSMIEKSSFVNDREVYSSWNCDTETIK